MSKGTRRERELVELYQQAGFATYRPATVRFGENDMFGLFDVLAVSPSHDRVHAIQVKSNRATGINGWGEHTALFRSHGWRTLYAVPVDNKGWRLIECLNGDRETLVDERDKTIGMGTGIVDYLGSISHHTTVQNPSD